MSDPEQLSWEQEVNAAVFPNVANWRQLNVPGRGDCAYWAIAIGMLCWTKALNHEQEFRMRLHRLTHPPDFGLGIPPFQFDGAAAGLASAATPTPANLIAYLRVYVAQASLPHGSIFLEPDSADPDEWVVERAYLKQLIGYMRRVVWLQLLAFSPAVSQLSESQPGEWNEGMYAQSFHLFAMCFLYGIFLHVERPTIPVPQLYTPPVVYQTQVFQPPAEHYWPQQEYMPVFLFNLARHDRDSGSEHFQPRVPWFGDATFEVCRLGEVGALGLPQPSLLPSLSSAATAPSPIPSALSPSHVEQQAAPSSISSSLLPQPSADDNDDASSILTAVSQESQERQITSDAASVTDHEDAGSVITAVDNDLALSSPSSSQSSSAAFSSRGRGARGRGGKRGGRGGKRGGKRGGRGGSAANAQEGSVHNPASDYPTQSAAELMAEIDQDPAVQALLARLADETLPVDLQNSVRQKLIRTRQKVDPVKYKAAQAKEKQRKDEKHDRLMALAKAETGSTDPAVLDRVYERIRKREERAARSEEEAAKDRETQRLAGKARRKTMTPEQRAAETARDEATRRARRAQLSADELAALLQSEILAKSHKRAERSESDVESERSANTGAKRAKRSSLTKEEKASLRSSHAVGERQRVASLPEAVKAIARASHAVGESQRRSSLSDSAKASIRSQDAASHRRSRAASTAAHMIEELEKLGLMTPSDLSQALQNEEFPGPVSVDLLKSLTDTASAKLAQMDRVCVVCDCFTPADQLRVWKPAQFMDFFPKLAAQGVQPPLHAHLIQYYSLAALHSGLQGALLSPSPLARQMDPDAEEEGQRLAGLLVCKECDSSLHGTSQHPPPNAIANNNAIGLLPDDLADVTWAEVAMVTRVYGRACIAVLDGGSQRALRGHVLNVLMDPDKVINQLPISPKELQLQVVIAGPHALSDPQKVRMMKMHLVRKSRVFALYKHLSQHHRFYDAYLHLPPVQLDTDVLNRLTEKTSLIDLQQNTLSSTVSLPHHGSGPAQAEECSVAAASASAAAAGKPAAAGQVEQSVDVRHLGSVPHVTVLNEAGEVDMSLHTPEENPENFTDSSLNTVRTMNSQVLALTTSNRYVSSSNVPLGMLFPDKFPYGRGDQYERRRKVVSLPSLLQRLVRLSTGQFISPGFVLKAYNEAARYQAQRCAYLKVSLSDLSFTHLTPDNLKQLLDYQQECSERNRQSLEPPTPPPDLEPQAKLLFRTVRAVVGAMPHSNEYVRNHARPQAFALWNRFGPPTLMFTFSPADMSSPGIIYYATEALRLPPFDPKKVPELKDRQLALAEAPGACALEFKRMLHLVIRHLIGWDLERHAPLKTGGIFGVPIALFAAVEEQNRGSLHAHILIWISGNYPFALRKAPPDQFASVYFQNLARRMSAYLESILSSQFLCPSRFIECPRADSHSLPAQSQGAQSQSAAQTAPLSLDRQMHFGQIEDAALHHQVQQRTSQAKTKQKGGNKKKLDGEKKKQEDSAPSPPKQLPPLCTCLLLEGGQKRQESLAFDPLPVMTAGVEAGRTQFKELLPDMTSLDFQVKDTYNKYHYLHPSIAFVPPPEHYQPGVAASRDYELFLLQLATVQLFVMTHDPKHRLSCLRKCKDSHATCRYKFPFAPFFFPFGTAAGPITLQTRLGRDKQELFPPNLLFSPWRDGLSAYQNQYSPAVTAVLGCNNDVRFVTSAGAAFYLTLYDTKPQQEELTHFHTVLTAMKNGLVRDNAQAVAAAGAEAAQTAAALSSAAASSAAAAASSAAAAAASSSSGISPRLQNNLSTPLQLIMRASRAYTSCDVVGAMMAAYLLLGGQRFISSHSFDSLPLSVALALVRKDKEIPHMFRVVPETDSEDVQLESESADAAAAAGLSASSPPSTSQPLPLQRPSASFSIRPAGAVISQLHDYLFRPDQLESVSWYTFVCCFQRDTKSTKQKQGLSVAGDEEDSGAATLEFQSEHPLAATHHLRRQTVPIVPKIYGGRLGDVRRMDPTEHNEQLAEGGKGFLQPFDEDERQLFARTCLLLFHPFRQPDFENLHSQPVERWQLHFPSMLDSTQYDIPLRRIFDNLQCYWLAQQENDEKKDEEEQEDVEEEDVDRARLNIVAEEEDFEDILLQSQRVHRELDEATVARSLDLQVDEQQMETLLLSGALDTLPSISSVPQAVVEAGDTPARYQWKRVNDQQKQKEEEKQQKAEEEKKRQLSGFKDVAPDAQWIPIPAVGELPTDDPPELRNELQHLRNRLSLLTPKDKAARPSPLSPLDPQMQLLHEDATRLILHVARQFQLNQQQLRAFLLVAEWEIRHMFHLQLHVNSDQQQSQPLKEKDYNTGPLILLGGAAGTGKSRVVHAVTRFYELLNRRRSLILTALTGVAAVLIGGRTVHSEFGINEQNKKQNTGVLTDALRSRYIPVSTVIIDEVSLMGADLFETVRERLRLLKNSAAVFGGVCVLFVGDFFQFPPVNRTSLMGSRKKGGGGVGVEHWRQFVNRVVLLTQQMRQAEDPRFAEILEHLRQGTLTLEDITLLNSRVPQQAEHAVGQVVADALAAERGQSEAPRPRNFTPIVVSENAPRMAFNMVVYLRLAQDYQHSVERHLHGLTQEQWRQQSPFFVILASFEAREKKGAQKQQSFQLFSDAEKVQMRVASQRTPLDAILPLFIGMRARITHNLMTEFGIANGSQVEIVRVHLTEEGQRAEVVYHAKSGVVRVLERHHVRCLVVQLFESDGQPSQRQLDVRMGRKQQSLPPGQFYLFKSEEDVDYSMADKQIKIQQFPLQPMFASTAHKLQGQTIDRLVLASTTGQSRFLYVVLSRLRALCGLSLLQPLPTDLNHSIYQRGAELIAEMQRLQLLQSTTQQHELYHPLFERFQSLLAAAAPSLPAIQPLPSLSASPSPPVPPSSPPLLADELGCPGGDRQFIYAALLSLFSDSIQSLSDLLQLGQVIHGHLGMAELTADQAADLLAFLQSYFAAGEGQRQASWLEREFPPEHSSRANGRAHLESLVRRVQVTTLQALADALHIRIEVEEETKEEEEAQNEEEEAQNEEEEAQKNKEERRAEGKPEERKRTIIVPTVREQLASSAPPPPPPVAAEPLSPSVPVPMEIDVPPPPPPAPLPPPPTTAPLAIVRPYGHGTRVVGVSRRVTVYQHDFSGASHKRPNPLGDFLLAAEEAQTEAIRASRAEKAATEQQKQKREAIKRKTTATAFVDKESDVKRRKREEGQTKLPGHDRLIAGPAPTPSPLTSQLFLGPPQNDEAMDTEEVEEEEDEEIRMRSRFIDDEAEDASHE